jgi:hypothetical protein
MRVDRIELLAMSLIAVIGFPEQGQACKQGFVWREASGPNDTVCVTSVERGSGALQNQGYPNETCPVGLVWREATQGDHRCVTPEERSLTAAQNASARDRD